MELRDKFAELFPIEDSDSFYTPYMKSKSGKEQVSAKGSIYNYYKVVRKELKDADILTDNTKRQSTSNECEGEMKLTFITIHIDP